MDQNFSLADLRGALNREAARWSAEENPITRLSPEEKKLRLGYTPGPGEPTLTQREQLALSARAAPIAAAAYPASYDLRNVGGKNFITPIRDQGQCGSCVAFGTIAAVEGTARVQEQDPNLNIDLSEAQLFYCDARSQGRTCENGWWVEPALQWMHNQGIADEDCYKYTAGDQACTNLCADWQNRATKVVNYFQSGNPADIKQWISTKGPVITCFSVYEDFFAYKSGIYHHVSGGLAGGHCVCIVGYSDPGGFWICKNSWGTAWGESGFFRIAYGECGIDGVLWGIDRVTVNTTLTNKRIQGLWANDSDRNAFAFIETAGWKKIPADNDNIFFDTLIELTVAKTANRPCNIVVQQGTIQQLTVL